jgi:hypothetical protein
MCPSINPGIFCGSIMANGLKSCTIGPSTSICCSWNSLLHLLLHLLLWELFFH